jgi:DegV family protein with EDD domain
MKKTVITADSGVIIGSEQVVTIPLVVIDTQTNCVYKDQEEISTREVYDLRAKGHRITTSCMNLHEAAEFFREQLKTADQIIHLTMSEKISQGALVTAVRAAEEVDARRIRVINSLQGGSGGPVVARKAAQLAAEDDNLDRIAETIEQDIIPRMRTAFVVPDPTGYKASGKGILNGFINMGISAFAAGSGLPVVKITPSGALLPTKKLRLKPGQELYVAFFDSQFDADLMDDDFISVCSLDPDPDRLEALKRYTAETLPHIEVGYGNMSAVIGAYACKDTLGVSYLTKSKN